VKAIVVLADRSRHEIEIDNTALLRGKLEFRPPQDILLDVSVGAPVSILDVRTCYRAGSDDGVPVFVER
jgi:hypothetical protein